MSNQNNADLALRYGNFKDYYSFNTVSSRFSLIDSLFKLNNKDQINKQKLNFDDDNDDDKSICILDCGCNRGDIGYEIAKKIKEQEPNKKVYLLGVDLDNELIEEAKKRTGEMNDENFVIEYQTVNIMSSEFYTTINNYFERHKLKPKFSLILCFSLTMWIHLNYGDDGFNDFLDYLGNNCKYLMVEPQPFRKYMHANKRMRIAGKEEFKYYYKIKIKNIDDYIIKYLDDNCEMSLVKHLGVTHWSRNIYLFQNKA